MGGLFFYIILLLVINKLLCGEATFNTQRSQVPGACSTPWSITVGEDFKINWYGEDRDADIVIEIKPVNASSTACNNTEITEKFHQYLASYEPCGNTLYKIDVKLICKNGAIHPKPVIFWPRWTDPKAPGDFKAVDVTNTTIKLQWDRPALIEEPIILYEVLKSKVGNFSSSDSFPTGDTWYEIGGLVAYTNYYFKVRAKTESNLGPWSEALDVITDIGVPSVPRNLSGVNVTSTSIELAWEEPEPANGPLMPYVVSWSIRGSSVVVVLVDGTSHVFEHLSPYTEYSFQIAAQTKVAIGPYTKRLYVLTDTDVPGEPRNVSAIEVTNTSISLEWEIPEVTNGPILGYVVHLLINTSCNVEEKEVETNFTFIQLEGLIHSTNYTIKICAMTAAGQGSWSNELNVLTKIGVPHDIQNLTVRKSATRLLLHWLPSLEEPSYTDDFLISWGVEGTMPSNVITKNAAYDALGLRPYTEYYFHIIPRNEAGPGPSTNIVTRTEIAAPTLPRDLSILETTDTNIFLKWLPPEHPNGPHLWYTIKWSTSLVNSSGEAMTNSTCYRIQYLDPSTNYSIHVVANTSAGQGPWSEELVVLTNDKHGSSNRLLLPLALGLVFVLLLIVLLLCGLVHAKKIKALHFFSRTASRKPPPMKTISMSTPFQMTQLEVAAPSKKSLNIHNFEDHMKSLTRYDFTKEFEELRRQSPQQSCDAAKLDENLTKNRWVKILPFDHSRVKILPRDGELRPNFINANYIPGDSYLLEYIATQGPLPNTLEDFWSMVWQQSVSTIVMLTQCVERAIKNCEKYWPSSGEKKIYGDIRIETVSESILTSYVQRVFSVQHRNQKRHVIHMHFTNWPVQGCPRSPDEFLHFGQKVRDQISDRRPGSVLVHCSAGVGRTGTFIAVDRLQQHLQHSKDIDIIGTVLDVRRYRPHMVNTEDQYIFIYTCIQRLLQERNHPEENIYELMPN